MRALVRLSLVLSLALPLGLLARGVFGTEVDVGHLLSAVFHHRGQLGLDKALDVREGLLRMHQQRQRLNLVVGRDGAAVVLAVVSFVFFDAEREREDQLQESCRCRQELACKSIGSATKWPR